MSSPVITESLERPIGRSGPRGPLNLWPVVTLPLSALVVWAVNAGGEALRWVGIGSLAWSLAIPMLVSLEAGLFALMLFEPLRGFLRRAQYLFLPYTSTDPIHLITPAVTALGFVLLLQRQKLKVFHARPMAGLVSLLGLIYFLQIFNPIQGGLSVGLSGALFYLVPLAWFYFGQDMKPEFLTRALQLVVVLGLITSLYGLYQLAYGFPRFEQVWVDNTDAYSSIAVGNIKRALATYSSAEEWGRYIQVGAIVAFGFCAGAVGYLRRGSWLLCGIGLTVMLLLTGQRTALFGLLLGTLILITIGAKTLRGMVTRFMVVVAATLLIAAAATAPTSDELLSHGEDERFQGVLTHTTKGALRPTEEGSFQERLEIWGRFATETIPHNPLGMGLGATSLGALRFDSSNELPSVDSYFISLAISCGLPAALLFMWILGRAALRSWRNYRAADHSPREAQLWRVVTALMPALILNSFFGNTFTLYSVAPVGWLLVGWISSGQPRKSESSFSDKNR
ncbi:MAG: O-antigen ligase family protein [Acidobacteriota bacterium]